MKPIVIIPAYNPDEKLIKVVEKLNEMNIKVIVVNDGSEQQCRSIFEILRSRLLCDICHHGVNRGKGAALKTGIQYTALNYPETIGYVTADADGQHSPEDILKVVNALESNPESFILGTRDFSGKGIPLKSFLGNKITSFVYLLSTGKKCSDTQTGLRGIPRKYNRLCLNVPGDKYEYEMNFLLEMGQNEIPFINVPIETIYLEKNASSHFNPIRDSALIYLNILKYSISSLLSAAADLSIFTIFANLVFGTGSMGILAATITARLSSGGMNFMINKFWVFESKRRTLNEAVLYFVLFCGQMMMSWLLVSSLSNLPLNLTLIKVIVDTGLFFISYQIQKNFIFIEKQERKAISG